MMVKKRWNANLTMLAGMFFLVLALSSRYGLQSAGLLGGAWSDGLMGCLFGIAIGTLLLSIWLRSHSAR